MPCVSVLTQTVTALIMTDIKTEQAGQALWRSIARACIHVIIVPFNVSVTAQVADSSCRRLQSHHGQSTSYCLQTFFRRDDQYAS